MYELESYTAKNYTKIINETVSDDTLAEMIFNYNIIYFISNSPVYFGLKKYGIKIIASNTPNHKWMNIIIN